MAFLSWIPRPKTKKIQVIIWITAIAALIAAAWWALNTLEIIPDAAGPIGMIDDVIILFGFIIFGYRLKQRIMGRYREGAFKKLLNVKDFVNIIFNNWVGFAIVALAVIYFIWALDIIPDSLPFFGLVDDGIMALAALVGFLRFLDKKK